MSALPTVPTFGQWLLLVSARPADVSALERAQAASSILVAYARALARTQGLDEHSAALTALEQVRDAMGEEAARDVATAQGLDLDGLLEQQREDAEQVERERQHECDVPWGTP